MEVYFDNSATTRVLDEVKDLTVKLMTEDFLFLYLQGLCDLGSGIFYILLCLHSLSVAGRGISVILCHKLHRQVLYFI